MEHLRGGESLWAAGPTGAQLGEEIPGAGVCRAEDRRGKRLAKQTPRDSEETLRIEYARLQEENELLRLELYLRKKMEELGRGGCLRQLRQERQYEAVRRGAEEISCPVETACRILGISRAGYYRWRSGKLGPRAEETQRIAGLVEQIHAENPDKGYRCIRDDLAHDYQTPVNDKRALRICRGLGIRSTIKYAAKGCTRRSRTPQHTAENLLDRDFHEDRPTEK